MSSAKRRSKKHNLEFNLTLEDIVIPEYCPVLNIKLRANKFKDSRHSSPTIDRVDNQKGYTKDNIVIISHRANTLKSNGSVEEHEKIAAYMKRHQTRLDILSKNH